MRFQERTDMNFKKGDCVRIVTREQTPADLRGGTFYPFYCGLEGTVDQIYDQEVCILVDHESLPQDVLKRHLSIQDSMKKKWLDGLSNEMRNRLTADDKRFQISYTLLVQSEDLEKAEPGSLKAAAVPIEKFSAPEKALDSQELDAKEEAYLEARKELEKT